jgi:putative sigma-54 modulation protein
MINTKIYGHHFEVTEGIKSHIDSRIEILEKHFEKLQLRFTLKVKSGVSTVEVQTRSSGKDFVMSQKGKDLYVVISKVIKKLDRWMRKEKEKIFTLKRRKPVLNLVNENSD